MKRKNLFENWSCFLDRDGVLNRKLDERYVRNWNEFEFLPGVLENISVLSDTFNRIIIVTNQRGIGKGLMTKEDLNFIHEKMLRSLDENGCKIDEIYFSDATEDSDLYRKPNIGMGLKAKLDFPDIIFNHSFMVGDSNSDMEFGKDLGMKTVLLSIDEEKNLKSISDIVCDDLASFCKMISSEQIKTLL